MQELVIDECITEVRAFIRDTLKGAPQRLARVAGLNRNTLAGWSDKDWNPTAETLKASISAIIKHQKGKVDLTSRTRNRKKKDKK